MRFFFFNSIHCMFNCIDIYSFIHASGCVGRGISTLLCPEGYNAAKTVLTLTAGRTR